MSEPAQRPVTRVRARLRGARAPTPSSTLMDPRWIVAALGALALGNVVSLAIYFGGRDTVGALLDQGVPPWLLNAAVGVPRAVGLLLLVSRRSDVGLGEPARWGARALAMALLLFYAPALHDSTGPLPDLVTAAEEVATALIVWRHTRRAFRSAFAHAPLAIGGLRMLQVALYSVDPEGFRASPLGRWGWLLLVFWLIVLGGLVPRLRSLSKPLSKPRPEVFD